jgi:hypothetical protein
MATYVCLLGLPQQSTVNWYVVASTTEIYFLSILELEEVHIIVSERLVSFEASLLGL